MLVGDEAFPELIFPSCCPHFMYLKAELSWNVVVPAEQVYGERPLLQRSIMLQLLEDFSNRKGNSDYGYFLAPTVLERIGDGKIRQDSGDVLFPVVFNCITFKPFKGEILCGVVNRVVKYGVFLSCGPIPQVFISVRKMGDYHHFHGEKQVFQNDRDSKIEMDVQVRFKVLGGKWIETESQYHVLGTLEGDYLGPIFRGESKF
ncbi:hypothetical protein MKW92_027283 [Papaver armeniacum]|nr:hypothetical protein MKW92_027283 [Papaver armeniacum]